VSAQPSDTDAGAALEAEFDTLAAWTRSAVGELGPGYAIPAACRGSGSEAWLDWLASHLDVKPTDVFLDAGAGLGGPGAWLRQERGITPVLAEPMWSAVSGAQRLFRLPAVAAWSQALPFRDASFDTGWLLGVLCTTPDHLSVLTELHRVLKPGGRLGLLVLVQVGPLPIQPEGNHFPTPASLQQDLRQAGLRSIAEIATNALPAPDEEWRRRIAAVDDVLERRYHTHPAWKTAREQEERITWLLYSGAIETRLVVADRLAV
jgi:SAM-dependent methyltransferase